MAQLREGSDQAAANLTEFFYSELRSLAASRLRHERPEHTLQPTALVHELYLELTKVRALNSDQAAGKAERDAFFSIAAFLMKRLLIHHARPLSRRAHRMEVSESIPGLTTSSATDLVEVENTLSQLEAIDPKLRAVVEMKVFEGLSRGEIAARLGCTERSVTRYWTVAKTWLQTELAGTKS